MTAAEINAKTFDNLRVLTAKFNQGEISHYQWRKTHEALIAQGQKRIAALKSA